MTSPIRRCKASATEITVPLGVRFRTRNLFRHPPTYPFKSNCGGTGGCTGPASCKPRQAAQFHLRMTSASALVMLTHER